MHVKHLKSLKECITYLDTRIALAEQDYRLAREGNYEVNMPIEEYGRLLTQIVSEALKIQDVIRFVADLQQGYSSVRHSVYRPSKDELFNAFYQMLQILASDGITVNTKVTPSNVNLIKCVHACQHYLKETQLDGWYAELPDVLEQGLLMQLEDRV